MLSLRGVFLCFSKEDREEHECNPTELHARRSLLFPLDDAPKDGCVVGVCPPPIRVGGAPPQWTGQVVSSRGDTLHYFPQCYVEWEVKEEALQRWE